MNTFFVLHPETGAAGMLVFVKPFLRIAGILLCALLGSTGIVLFLALALRHITILSISPEDMLPSDTELFFTSPTTESYASLRSVIADLPDLPTPLPEAFAIIRGQSVSFWKGGDESEGRYRRGMYVSDRDDLLLPSSATGALSATQSFRALSRYTRRDTPTVYLSRTLLPEYFRGVTHIRASLMEGRTDLALFPSKSDTQSSLPPAFPASDESTFLLVTASGEAFAERVSSVVSPKAREIMESMLRTETSALFGGEVSPLAHLKPLIREWTAFEIVETASGIALLLEGRAASFDRAQDDINELHAAFQSSLPQSRTMRRLFDGRFLHESIRWDDTQISDERRNVVGWAVRETSGDGRMLASAILGRTVLLSTNAPLLEERLRHPPSSLFTPPLPAKGPPPRIFAAGRFDADLLPEKNVISALFGSGTFVWSLGERGKVETLTILRYP